MNASHLPSPKATRVYAYTEPHHKVAPWKGPRSGKGVIKVGYTTKPTAAQRLEEIYPVKGPTGAPYQILFDESAVKPDGTFFTDHSVHKALKSLGAHRLEGEWFEATLDEIKAAFLSVKEGKTIQPDRTDTFGLRPEQEASIKTTIEYFETHKNLHTGRAPHFLWNAKMRFGKTFTAYQLAKRMGWKRILILTYKPAVKTAWEEDLKKHTDFEGWQFLYKETWKVLDQTKPLVLFASFQDILGRDENGHTKPKFDEAILTEWDCIILDEYHFGSWKDKAKGIMTGTILEDEENLDGKIIEETIKGKHFLYLSGTPFRSLQNGEFTEDQIFHWAYQDEQKAKENWVSPPENPYLELPKMVVMTYQMPEELREVAKQGELNEFNLGEFFLAKYPDEESKKKREYEKTTFKHKSEVQRWLDIIKGKSIKDVHALIDGKRPPLPFEDPRLLPYLNHTLWLLPDVAACYAMKKLLLEPQNGFYHDYTPIVAAGNDAGMGAEALPPVLNAIGNDPFKTKTITLTCGKLTTGVTVPAWTGIFMLRNLNSPETYFQAAFRVQSPWVVKNSDPLDPNKKEILKETCYVFDFAPNRALSQIAEYNARLNNGDDIPMATKIEEFLKFLPVLCYDGGYMKELNATELLDMVVAGTAASMLARKFQSPQLINLGMDVIEVLLENQDLIDTLEKITAHRNLNSNFEKIINAEKALKNAKKENREPTESEKKTGKEEGKKKENIKKLLLKFLTRIPIFMYLTDAREENLKHVIEAVETNLFEKTTGINLNDFHKLCDAGVFNGGKLSHAIYAFRLYEAPSLRYIGGTKETLMIGGWDNSLNKKEAEEMLSNK